MMGSAWISIKLNVYDALLAMVISELKTDSVSIYLQYLESKGLGYYTMKFMNG